MNGNPYPIVIVVETFIIVLQMGVIYGLVNRLIRQSGQNAMNAHKALMETLEGPPATPTPKPREVTGSIRIAP